MEHVEIDYVDVGDIPTHVVKTKPTKDNTVIKDSLVLIIPGNPGIADFYIDFMHRIHQNSEKKTPVWCMSHARHVTVPHQYKSGSKSWKAHTLKEQIEHKLDFVKQHVPKKTKLFLIGHSIGAYMILHMLSDIGERVEKCYMMFPTVERMGESPGGQQSIPLLRFHRILPYPVYIAHYLPDWLKHKLVSWYERKNSLSHCAKQACLNIFDPHNVWNFLYMANIEMRDVDEADHDIIDEHKDKLVFYYGSSDRWTPLHYYKEMKDRYPDMEVLLDEQGTDHAFVLQHSTEMGDLIHKWMQNYANQSP